MVASFQDIRRDEARLRLLRFVSEHPDASTRDIAKAIGVSNGAAFYLLKALIEKGLVKARNLTASNSKARHVYVLTPSGVTLRANLTLEFLERKRQEYAALREEIASMESDLDVIEPHTLSNKD